jgi:DNA polymerase III alpha subunit (gram-positive type)
MNKLLFLDVETTGLDEEDRLCQVAFTNEDMDDIYQQNFKPPVPIKVGAMAVSHITNHHVENEPAFIGSDCEELLKEYARKDYIFVAHNAPFDLKMLEKEGIKFKRFIDTKKLSHAIDKEDEMESHRLQYLRYFYDLQMDDAVAHTRRS